MSKEHIVAALLIDIESELRQLQLWEREPPSCEALASQQPFCIDTLKFSQWLQFVFIPKIKSLLDQNMTLPDSCAIAPMAEEFYRGTHVNVRQLLKILQQLDQQLNQN
jgi:uncharacterized protein YqcC (DUF446 family)